MAEKIPMTTLGYQALKDELKKLKTVDRLEASKAIEVARGHGDLSENAEYDAAKERQGFIEGRIREIESKLALAEVIDPTKLSGDRVVFGATVTLSDAETDEESTYQIVGLDEADLKAGKISVTSPMARAMIGKSEGDDVSVKSPKGGAKEYSIVKVQFL
ncbi:transcription elongation factor GreA [Myxococcota bacterium]|nr:transcription elongation factor GreA [Myxococcota bacterium]